MKQLYRTRIAARSTLLILAVTLAVGLPLLLLLLQRARIQEEARQRATLDQLLDTVERTAQVACFVGDRRLAEEVAAGLLKNEIVGQATLSAGERPLATETRPDWVPGTAPWVTRDIRSPFDPAQVVGRIALAPDEASIARRMAQEARNIAFLLALQLLLVAAASVSVVLLLVTRPIARLSRRVHHVHAETGETLRAIPGHESDEIGRLVEDVNGLIDRLLTFIHAERFLREEMAHEHAKLMDAKAALERSLAEVKTLQGLLPICAWCKKVRDDEGLWTQIEKYVSANTDARFTHGLCPECAKAQVEEYERLKAEGKAGPEST